MDRDDLLRVLSRYAPRDEWSSTSAGYVHRAWSVRVHESMAWVRRDLPNHAHVLIAGDVDDIEAMMARAERMAWWDAMEAE